MIYELPIEKSRTHGAKDKQKRKVKVGSFYLTQGQLISAKRKYKQYLQENEGYSYRGKPIEESRMSFDNWYKENHEGGTL